MLGLSWFSCWQAGGRAGLLEAIGDAPTTEVIGREFDEDAVAGEDLDEIHPDLAADVREHFMAVGEFDPEHGVRERLCHGPFDFDGVLLGHTLSYFAQAGLRECEDFGLTSRPDGDCMLEMTA